ncbi:MAG TPA: hypothetical protein VEO74_05925, partial [Thermoanaerobaculia bacterium]|nr:hypothetical protein [Thermoanaerobaculia bacterium]
MRDTDKNVQQILQARLFEVEGQAQPNPERAVVAFTNAFKRTSPEYRTYRAALLAERAKAERKLGRGAEADRDLRAALSELNAEETAILEHRERGKGEELWSSYFSRFQETYRLLIQQTIDAHPSEAFAYAERARAFEPLDLILHLDVVPQAFRGQESLERIRAYLPAGTVLLEYCALDDLTYTWIISHDRVEAVKLDVKKRDIERWSS